MKFALCFSGQPRYLNDGYIGVYENILSKYSPDVFVHTWWDDSMKNGKMDLSSSLAYNRTYYWEKNTLDLIESLLKQGQNSELCLYLPLRFAALVQRLLRF